MSGAAWSTIASIVFQKAQRLDSAYERTRSTHYSSLPCMYGRTDAHVGINPSSWPPREVRRVVCSCGQTLQQWSSFPKAHQGLNRNPPRKNDNFAPAAHKPITIYKIASIFTLKIYLDGNVNLPWDIFVRAFEGKAFGALPNLVEAML